MPVDIMDSAGRSPQYPQADDEIKRLKNQGDGQKKRDETGHFKLAEVGHF